jgi:tetratricopeptide (TPR) repeat protein
MLEKNIALALFNKGHYVEAVKHLDNVLECWGERQPKNKYVAMFILINNLLYVLKHLYFPSKKEKKIPKEKDNEIININEKRTIPLAHIDAKRFFMESIKVLKRLFKLDITKVENGASIFTEGSSIFSFTGISFKISKKILDFAKDFINKNDIKSLLYFKYTEIMHNYLSGNWRNQPEYDEHVVDRKLNVGDVFHTGGYTLFSGFLEIEQGNFKDAHVLVDKLFEIGEVFDNDQTRGRKYLLNTKLLVKSRRLPDALKEVNAKISLQNIVGINFALCLFGMRPYIQMLMKDIQGAEISLLQIKELVSHEERIVPFYICNFLMSQFLFDLCVLEDSIHSRNKPKTKITHLQKKAYRSGKAAVKNAMKYAADKTEAFKLMGVYDWLIGKQKKALVWWDKSIKIGEYLGARPELARTYMEVGKRLLEKKSKFQQLNGIKAEEYLKKARLLFKEMELKWDLEQLDKIRS